MLAPITTRTDASRSFAAAACGPARANLLAPRTTRTHKSNLLHESHSDMGFIVDICTGATQGIGRAIAESIAHHRAMEIASASGDAQAQYALFLVGRNVERGTKAAKDIQSKESGGLFSVFFEPCDLSDYDSVLDLKNRVCRRLGECEPLPRFRCGRHHCAHDQHARRRSIVRAGGEISPRGHAFIWAIARSVPFSRP